MKRTFRMTAMGEYADDDTASTMKSRDYKDATDLVVEAWDNRGRDGGAQFEGPHDTANIRAGSGGSSRSYVLAPKEIVEEATPINTQIATRHEALGRGTGLGIGAPGDPAYTLQSAHSHAVAGFAQGTLVVRRLTPTECARLQGFPDDYLDNPGAKDGNKYKALGNSMAVPCMAYIGHRIQTVFDLMEKAK